MENFQHQYSILEDKQSRLKTQVSKKHKSFDKQLKEFHKFDLKITQLDQFTQMKNDAIDSKINSIRDQITQFKAQLTQELKEENNRVKSLIEDINLKNSSFCLADKVSFPSQVRENKRRMNLIDHGHLEKKEQSEEQMSFGHGSNGKRESNNNQRKQRSHLKNSSGQFLSENQNIN